jgi:hypothetical protein
VGRGQGAIESGGQSHRRPRHAQGRVHDWFELAAFMIRYVIENDLPKTQAELVTVMERWFETNEKKIAPESDLQKFASLIFQEIDAQTPDLKPAHQPSARQSGPATPPPLFSLQ